MLNYTQATEIIKLMQADLRASTNTTQEPNQVCRELYNYLNYAGGRTLIPIELKTYKNTLAIFQNPQQALASIQRDKKDYIELKKLQKEAQTIALLWLRAAATTLSQDIDLNSIINECHRGSAH